MILPAPYYADGACTIYCADCRPILAALNPRDVALVLADPPYGARERTDRKSKGRSNLAECNDFPPVAGDDEDYDPTPLLRFPRLVAWGANWYANRLPPSPSWLTWDKRDGMASNDNADCEHAWTNLGGPARLFAHRWSGMIKASEGDERREHPTQKPVALAKWILSRWTKPGDLVVDPYMGSGYVAVACKELGRRFMGIEIVEHYCGVAVRRLRQEVLAFGGAA